MADAPDANGNADKQSGRAEPTSSETSLEVDIGDNDAGDSEPELGDLTTEDIQDPELRQAVKEAQAEHGVSEGGPAETDGPTSDDAPSDEDFESSGQQVRVSEGESPFEAMAKEGQKNAEYDSVSEAKEAYANGEISDAELDDAIEGGIKSEDDGDEGGLMDGVSDDDIEDAMDMELNVRDDIDPEHFDYEDQDFSVFGGYGQAVTIEFNETLFHLVQPSGREQEALINDMGGGLDDDGMDLTEMMQALIDATVARPDDIDEITSEWTPFERMGLGMQCMEFLGLDALGNI